MYIEGLEEYNKMIEEVLAEEDKKQLATRFKNTSRELIARTEKLREALEIENRIHKKIKEVENKKKELMEKEKESCADEYFFYEMYGCDSQLIMLKELLSNENKG